MKESKQNSKCVAVVHFIKQQIFREEMDNRDLNTLYQMQLLFSIKRCEKIVVFCETQITGDKTVAAYFKVLPWHWLAETEEMTLRREHTVQKARLKPDMY
jgi:hypothetical protein